MSDSTKNIISGDPSKSSGKFHSVKGNVVEGVGKVTGSTAWKQSGQQEHAAGEAETKAAQTKGYAQGTGDRIVGKKDQIIGGITGDKSQEASGNIQQTKGEFKQDVNR